MRKTNWRKEEQGNERVEKGKKLTWLWLRWWCGWNVDIRVELEFHKCNRYFGDATRRNGRDMMDRGIKVTQNHGQQHPVRERHLFLMRRGITGDDTVGGKHIMEMIYPMFKRQSV